MDTLSWVLLVLIAILFLIDIISTTYGIFTKKLVEKGPLMKYVADKPLWHILLKFIAVIIVGAVLLLTQNIPIVFWAFAVVIMIMYAYVDYNNLKQIFSS